MIFVNSHWKIYENINQFLFFPWHNVAKLIWFFMNTMAKKMFFHILKENVLIEENVGTSWGHLCGRQGVLFRYMFLSLLNFHKSTLILFPTGLSVKAYNSAKLTSYLNQVFQNLDLKWKIKNKNERERDREKMIWFEETEWSWSVHCTVSGLIWFSKSAV